MTRFLRLLLLSALLTFSTAQAQNKPVNLAYSVSMEAAAEHLYHVELTSKSPAKTLDFKMCAWTPGYYQLLDFAGAVQDFQVQDAKGNILKWEKPGKDIWRVHNDQGAAIKISYNVKATIPFVGNVYLDETRGYITPGGLFM